jgi:hypothetical protein
VEAKVRVSFQKREGQDLTGAIGEEVPIGPVPASGRIILIFGKNIALTILAGYNHD